MLSLIASILGFVETVCDFVHDFRPPKKGKLRWFLRGVLFVILVVVGVAAIIGLVALITPDVRGGRGGRKGDWLVPSLLFGLVGLLILGGILLAGVVMVVREMLKRLTTARRPRKLPHADVHQQVGHRGGQPQGGRAAQGPRCNTPDPIPENPSQGPTKP
jgi:uncharacterized membrane protein